MTFGRRYTAPVPQTFMKHVKHIAILPALLLFGSCTPSATNSVGDSSSASSQAVSSIRETNNVSYTGTVQTAGISIYMEGTHRLSLQDGKFILLESDAVDLNGYVGEEAKVLGSIRPTVEAGGMIMRVDSIELMANSSSVTSETASSFAESSLSTSESVSGISSAHSSVATSGVTSSVSISQIPSSAATTVSSLAAVSSAITSSSLRSSDGPMPSGNAERIESMSRQDLTPALWTQQYCTSHIGFCIPVHKNWWFRSFGTTSSELWHVEISSEPIESLQDGPIVLRLMTGVNTAPDGSVIVQNGVAVYTKLWLTDQHIEIVADESLEDAVRYIGEHLDFYNPGE